ncbi:MAG: biopolymer transporter ExbD [Isosphaeraceae bacterium]
MVAILAPHAGSPGAATPELATEALAKSRPAYKFLEVRSTGAEVVANWDVFHADRLELERGLSAEDIRAALARSALQDDDLVRPAGSSVPWARIADIPELMAPSSDQPAQPEPSSSRPADLDSPPGHGLPDFEEVQPSLDEVVPPPRIHELTLLPESSPSDVAFPVIEAEIKASEPAPTAQVIPPAPGWTWNDDDEDEDDEDELEDDDDRHVVLEDQGDMEILANEDELAPADEDEPRGPAHSHDHARAGAPQPGQPHASAVARERFEPGEHDLDFDDRFESRSSHLALPVVRSRDRDDKMVADGDGGDDEAAFSLSRSATEKIEELDLAPMVDVAFNLVLFFMVTATTVLYKTLEIPKPSGEAQPSAVAQGRSRSLDDLKDDFILVEIDESGNMKLDREPIAPVMETLVEQLRRAREKTGRKTMLLSADYATLHRNAVLAYDAANEIGMGIAIAKPQAPQGPAPTLRGSSAAAPRPTPPAAGG